MRRRLSKRLIVVIELFVLESIMIVALLAFATTEVTAQAAQKTLYSVDGQAVNLADHRGQVIVLTFNATWAPMTDKSLLVLQRIANLYEGRGVVFYWVSINGAHVGDKHYISDADLKAFAVENGLRLKTLRDPERTTFRAFGLDAIPSIVIIDRAGRVYQKHVGFDATPTQGYQFIIKPLNNLLK